MADNEVTDKQKSAPEAPDTVLLEMLKSLRDLNISLQKSIAQRDAIISSLQEQIANLQKVIFGTRSEKSVYIDAAQQSLFDEKDKANGQDVLKSKQTQEPVHIKAHDRKPKRSQEEIYASLPQKEELIELPEDQRVGSNGKPLIPIGKKVIRKELRSTPAKYWVALVTVQMYKEDNGEEEQTRIIMPDVPAPLIEHSPASASIVAHIILNKYFSGLPLYRQEQSFRHQGLPLTRSIMTNWTITTSDLYLEKLYLRLCKLIVQQPVIHADETTVQVLKEPGRKPQQKSYMWVYSTSKRAEKQIRCFVYENSRSGECANNFLKEFSGILISDGYSGYLKVCVVRAGCWAHMRRKWLEAMPRGLSSENSAPAIGLRYCTQLFESERRIEHLSDAERVTERQKICNNRDQQPKEKQEPLSAKEILLKYWEWVGTFDYEKLTGKLKTAVGYALNQKQYLETFLEHGEIEISNNQVENAIRPFVVGRKGWLFSDTVKGAHASAVIYSLIETAKANNIKAGEWLEHVLSVLPERFAYDPNDCIDDLLPWTDEMQSRFKLGK